MTGDLGPGEFRSDNLTAVFEPYLLSAAGLAAEEQDNEAAALLRERLGVEVRFADMPITAAGGKPLAAVDVVLMLPESLARRVADGDRQRLADLLNEVAGPDGYHVRAVQTIRSPDG
jgi:selenophosphate synthetase-related protein